MKHINSNRMFDNIGKLEKVEIRKVWPKEDSHFTPWLAQEENIAILGDELNIDLEVQAQEEYVGPFRADILCKDTATENFVVIENQFGKTDHNHLGQIITYAAGLKALTVVWIAEHFVEEHRAAIDWLNSISDDSVEFFGIEIKLYRIANSPPAPKFNIVSKPNTWSKSVKRTASSVSLTETKLLQQEYWQALKDYVESTKVSFKMQKPSPQHWSTIAVGRSGFHINALANTRDKWICVQLVVSGNNALEHFTKLREMCETDSKEAISDKIKWLEKEGKEHHVNLVFHNTDPTNKSQWPEQHKILNETIEKFRVFFKDKVKKV